MSVETGYEGIIILGMPRSGTTLFRRILDAHPAICCPPETNLFNAASRFLEEQKSAQGLTVGVMSGLSFSGYDDQEILDRLREFVFGFHREIRDRQGKKIWAEKTAFDSFHLKGIHKLCGDKIRYLCLFRNGLDAVCSIKELCDKLEIYYPELHEYVIRHPSPYQAFAHAWSDVNGNLLRLTVEEPEIAMGLRYEDLVDDPVAVLTRVFDFLGLPTDVDALLATALDTQADVGFGDWKTYQTKKINSSSVGRWKSLHPETVSELGGVLNPLMKRLGYDTVDETGAVDEAEARRRLQLGLMVAKLASSGKKPDEDESGGKDEDPEGT